MLRCMLCVSSVDASWFRAAICDGVLVHTDMIPTLSAHGSKQMLCTLNPNRCDYVSTSIYWLRQRRLELGVRTSSTTIDRSEFGQARFKLL
jgi:hypothetical protein